MSGSRLSGGLVVGLAVALLVAACGGSAGPTSSAAPVTLRLGYFPNVTHAAAVVGVAKGFFAQALGANVTLDAKTFNAGPDAVTALFGNSLDATFIGPNPAICPMHAAAVMLLCRNPSRACTFDRCTSTQGTATACSASRNAMLVCV